MICPTRPIRTVDAFTSKYNYYDHETVIQEDGRIAKFTITNHTRDKGWIFQGYEDKYGFCIWDDEDRSAKWDNTLTMEMHLLRSVRESVNVNDVIHEFGNNFSLNENELLLSYEYGGIMSQRGGYLIVHKDNPTKILRSIQTMIS
jgi:hypothetical protein